MTNNIQTIREKNCELGCLLFGRNLSDAEAYILLQIDAHPASGLIPLTFSIGSALLKERPAKYGKSFE